VQIQIRNGTAAQWTSANPTLAAGEVGIETDTRKQKFGDGTTAWNSLAYAGATGTVTGVTAASPVLSSGGAIPSISLASGYGDTLNPYASKTANQVLAAPNGASGVPSFRALVSADIPTLNQNTTGTAAGLSSTLAIGSGGTGQTSAISAFNALAPSQSGNSGKYLTTDGTNSSWGTVSGGGSPGGSSGYVQYNNGSGGFAGSANLTFNGTTLTAAGLAGPHDGTVGASTPNTGSFTTLAASSTVSGTGFSTYLASPPAIGGTAAAAGTFTTGSFSSTVHRGATSGTVTMTAPAVAGTQAYTLPTALPTASGSSLQCTTAGVMSWVAGTPAVAPSTVQYLVVGGGGGGAGSIGDSAGGGGAGGLLTGSSLAVSTGISYAITVGAFGVGGTGSVAPTQGTASLFGSLVNGSTGAVGGGGGGSYLGSVPYNGATSGGSGGGGPGYSNTAGGAGTSGQGNAGGTGGAGGGGAGGGGSGSVGANGINNTSPGAGGSGSDFPSGSAVFYAGGGGGSANVVTSPALGGSGVGGNGSTSTGTSATSGAVNTGSGGGAGGSGQGNGANGGSGVVIIRYADTFAAATATTGSPTITVAGGFRTYKFTGSGSITF
jgi:hypothetical protein